MSDMFDKMKAQNKLISKSIEEIKKESWNAAIEVVCSKLDEIGEMGLAEDFRKLKT